MIIFTGTGRSGTGLYEKLFNTYHEYNVSFITKYFTYPPSIPDPFVDFERRKRIMMAHLKDVDIDSFRDSSNPYIHFLDALYVLDKNIRIVLGVRDGRDFVTSAITRGYHDENKYRLFSMIPTEGDPYYEKWAQMTPLKRCAWMWVYRNQKALDRWETVPEKNKHLVRLEDIGNMDVLEELEEFLGLKAERKWLNRKVNANRGLQYPPKEEWTEEMSRRFYKIAGKMMKKLGYPSSPKTQFSWITTKKVQLTIGMPVYNEGKFIDAAIESLLSQTYKNFILIISDNASTDQTPEICKHYAKRDSRVIYIKHNKNEGALFNFRCVLDKTSTPFFMWAGGHDKWYPMFIEKLLPIIASEDIILIYPKSREISINGSERRVYGDNYTTTDIDKPTDRFLYIIKHLGKCNIIHGIWRTRYLKKCSFKPVVGWDNLILAQASFEGKFKQQEEELFFRRKIRENESNRPVRQYVDITGQSKKRRYSSFLLKLRLMFEHIKFLFRKRSSLSIISKFSLPVITVTILIPKLFSVKALISNILKRVLPSKAYSILKDIWNRK